MTPLRQRMIEELRVRNFTAKTQTSCVQYVSQFASYFQYQFQLASTFNFATHLEFRKRKQQFSPVLNEGSKVIPAHINWLQVS